MTFEDKIKNGYYENKLPYRTYKQNQQMNDDYRNETRRLENEFKEDVLQACGLANHPKRDRIFLYVMEANDGESKMVIYESLIELSDLVK